MKAPASAEAKGTAPVELNDKEMDQVTGGGSLLDVTVKNNEIITDNQVGGNAAVSAAVAVLGGAACGAAAKLMQVD